MTNKVFKLGERTLRGLEAPNLVWFFGYNTDSFFISDTRMLSAWLTEGNRQLLFNCPVWAKPVAARN